MSLPRRGAAAPPRAAACALLLLVAAAFGATLSSAASSKAFLTTKNGLIVDQTGKEVVMKGINWFGWNTFLDATGNFTNGADAVAQDAGWATARAAMMGFNAVRLPFRFRDVAPGRVPYNYTRLCGVPSQDDAKASSVVPPAASRPAAALLPAATRLVSSVKVPLRLPSQDFPDIPMFGATNKGICNAEMPQLDARKRFLWNVELLIKQGMYVMLDYHPGIDIPNAERDVLDVEKFVAGWKDVLSAVLEAVPSARGRLLVDLLNEPDGFALTWNSAGGAFSVKSPSQDPKGLVYAPSRPSLNALYSAALDALFPICEECVFLLEGGGQSSVGGVHWGNGFISDEGFAAKASLQTPNAFFDAAIEAPWLRQLALAPHIYCPRVSGAADCFEGECLFDSLDASFGRLTTGSGYCSRGRSKKCKTFPALIGELGSTLENAKETSCIASVVDWVMASGAAASPSRVPYRSVFWWAWNPDSEDTGGLVELRDWRSISWPRFEILTGGTARAGSRPKGLGLRPWYLESFTGAVPLDLPEGAAASSSSAATGNPRKALRGDGKGSSFSTASPGAVAVAVGIPLLCLVAIVSSALVWRASARAEKRRLAAVAAASAAAAAAKGNNGIGGGSGMERQPTWAETVFANNAALSSSSVKGGAQEYQYPPPPAISQPPSFPPPHMFPSATAVPLAFAPTRGGDATAAAAAANASTSTTTSSSPRLFGGSGPSTPRSRRARGGFFSSGRGGGGGQ